MTIYLNVSCLGRPFDDQRQARVRLEAEAVTLIFQRIDERQWSYVSSEIAEIEVAAIPDRQDRRAVKALLPDAGDIIQLTSPMFERAEQLQGLGFKAADALHVAAAEAAGADVLLSCDDRFCRLGRRHRSKLDVRVVNPLEWLQETGHA